MPLQDGLSSFAKDDFEAALRLVCDPLIPLSEKTDSIQFLLIQLNSEVNRLIVSLTSLTSKRELDIEMIASETLGAFIKYLLNSEHRLYVFTGGN